MSSESNKGPKTRSMIYWTATNYYELKYATNVIEITVG